MNKIFKTFQILTIIYCLDFHKLICSIIHFFTNSKYFGSLYSQHHDFIILMFLGAFLFMVIFFHQNSKISFNYKDACILYLFIVYTVSLFGEYNPFAQTQYLRFLGINLFIYITFKVACSNKTFIQTYAHGIVLVAIVHTLISFYLYSIGITWTSGRVSMFPGTGIRSGYYGSTAILVILTYSLFYKIQIYHYILVIGIAFGVLLSGVKFALFTTGFGVISLFIYAVINKTKNKVRFQVNGIILLILCCLLLFSYLKDSLIDSGGYIDDIFIKTDYISGFLDRMVLNRNYMRGVDFHYFLVGNGISSTYELQQRTHSLITSMFIQMGLLGFIMYLIINTFVFSKLRIKTFCDNEKLNKCLLFIIFFVYLAKSEVTGDIPSNRLLFSIYGIISSTYIFNQFDKNYRFVTESNSKQ